MVRQINLVILILINKIQSFQFSLLNLCESLRLALNLKVFKFSLGHFGNSLVITREFKQNR